MKKALLDSEITGKLELYQQDLNGIFTTADLYNIMGAENPIANQRAIKRLVSSKYLIRVKRGLYVTKSFDAWTLSRHLNPKAYISLDAHWNSSKKQAFFSEHSKKQINQVCKLSYRYLLYL